MKANASLLIPLIFIASLNFTYLSVGSRVIDVPKDYSEIQKAIDEANPGDVIRVASGTYFGNVKIRKTLSLISEGPGNTIIDGRNKMVIVKVYADNVEIRGFTVKNGTYGIFLWYCSGTLLRNNVMTNNTWNFGVWGDSLSHYLHDIDSSNLVDGKPIYYWLNQHDKQVPRDAGYVALANCTNVTVEDAVLTSNEHGVLLVNTNYSLIENVTMFGNDRGIDLRMSNSNTVRMNNLISINWQSIYCAFSHNNTFTKNTIRDDDYGILTENSEGNIIYYNNFINNVEQAYQISSSNTWDNGREGNYWSDYKGTDTDGDGIGDTPYTIDANSQDRYPLVKIFDETPPKADAGRNQTVMEKAVVTFNGSSSWDNIEIIEYNWDFGDGADGSGTVANHSYDVAGLYKVTLTVADISGNADTDVIWVNVINSSAPFPWWIVFAVISTVAVILVTVHWLRRRSGKRIEEV